jgi:hypothetical protein
MIALALCVGTINAKKTLLLGKGVAFFYGVGHDPKHTPNRING